MKLYLLRHAAAVDVALSDAERELTREGREEARIAGAALAELGVKVSHILTSPLVRARQTADIVAKVLKFPGDVESLDELENSTSTPALLKALKSLSLPQRGHSGRSHAIAVRTPGRPDRRGKRGAFPLGKASIACIELEQWRIGTGQLRWLMRQKQLQEIADR